MSTIDPTQPEQGQATTQSVRDNFQAAADELDALLPGGAQSFAAHLAGYQDTGFHEIYVSDLDLIAVNSSYFITKASTTNWPTDFTTDGYVITDVVNADVRTQVLIGRGASDEYKQWRRPRGGGGWDAWKLVVDGGVLNFAGVNAIYPVMPTSDPGVPGALWNNGGVVNISL